MKITVKEKWVKALRSGKFLQGRYRLRRALTGRTEHCCLGVLCEVMGAEINGAETFPPRALMQAVGLAQEEATILANLNDGQLGPPRPFEEIADYIEHNL